MTKIDKLTVGNFLRRPFRLSVLAPFINRPGVKVLDLGCANGSPSVTKQLFPNCRYTGVDLVEPKGVDRESCDEFIQADLESIESDCFPPESFDVVILSHVVEHLSNGKPLAEKVSGWLRPGGVFYIETPSERSLRLPSMRGTLNFYDDPTHVRVYPVIELSAWFDPKLWIHVRQGIRRQWRRVILLPAYLARGWKFGLDPAPILWDATGFAHYLVVKKR